MGTATGTTTNGLVLTTTIPDDAALVRAGDVNVPVQTLLDNDAYLASRGVVATYVYAFDDPADFATPEAWNTTSYVAASLVTVDVPDTEVGDILAIDLAGYTSLQGLTGHNGMARLKITEQYGGASPAVVNPSGARLLGFLVADGTMPGSSSITCRRTVASAGTARVTLEGKVSNVASTFRLINVCTLRVLHLRAF